MPIGPIERALIDMTRLDFAEQILALEGHARDKHGAAWASLIDRDVLAGLRRQQDLGQPAPAPAEPTIEQTLASLRELFNAATADPMPSPDMPVGEAWPQDGTEPSAPTAAPQEKALDHVAVLEQIVNAKRVWADPRLLGLAVTAVLRDAGLL